MDGDNPAFLTYKNRDYIADVARRYLSDKFKWIPPDTAEGNEAFMGLVENVLSSVAGLPDSGRLALGDLNKRAITAIRYRVIAPETLATTSSVPGPTLPLPVMDRGESGAAGDGDADGDEASFMEKLQELEQRRKVLWAAPPVATAPPVASAPVPPAATAPAVAPAPTPILLVPPTPIAAPSVPFIIHGWDRNRREHPGRAAFVWNGRIPPTIAPTSLKVACIWLPASATTSDPTPYVRLEVTGAGRQVADVICCGSSGASAAHWTLWKPCSDSLARLPALAPPWMLRVRTAEGHLLDLGTDDAIVRGASSYGGSLRLDCGGDRIGVATLGETLHLYLTNGDLVRVRVSGRIGADLLVDLIIAGGADAGAETIAVASFIGAEIVNVSRQIVVLLEGSLTTHQRERERDRDS